jgi:thiol-disulfide isomerase/thioredoxin
LALPSPAFFDYIHGMHILGCVRNGFFYVVFMKTTLFLVIGLTLPGCLAHAGRMDVPMDVQEAFVKAGLPLLREKRPARDFTLKALNGDEVALSGLRGQVVFLNFWATWCPPCRAEMPSMETLYRRFKDQGLAFAAVALMERAAVVEDFIEENGFTFPALPDTMGAAGARYGIQAVPTTLVLDRDGQVIVYAAGARKWDTPEMIAAFERLLNYER